MKTVLVVGLARSGTSLTCGVLKYLGVNIAHSDPQSWQLRHNPKGNFESAGLIGIIEDISTSLASGDINKQRQLENDFHNMIAEVSSDLWGFKFPDREAIVTLLPLLSDPHIIIPLRSCLENAKSLCVFERETGLVDEMRDFSQVLADIHTAQQNMLERLTRCNTPKLFLAFQNILSDPITEAQKIATFLDIKCTPKTLRSVSEFVDPKIHTWKEENGTLTPIDPR